MIDFHTHILPGIDDGSASAEESVKMLKMLEEQGVSKVVLTPHFYAHYNSVEEFLENRKRAVKQLVERMKNERVGIELYLGCEVLFFDEVWRIDNLDNLCIQGTDYILLEMPFSKWHDDAVKCVENLISRGYTPIIAHFERYINYKGNMEKIYKIIESGALLQVNCSSLSGFFKRRKIMSFIKRGMVFAIGTDAHNLTTRPPEFLQAAQLIKKTLSERQYAKFISHQNALIRKAQKIE